MSNQNMFKQINCLGYEFTCHIETTMIKVYITSQIHRKSQLVQALKTLRFGTLQNMNKDSAYWLEI